jgi:hypothetical protein
MKDMMKLALDADFRTALQNMKTEIKNAGVDLENPVRGSLLHTALL